MLWEVSLRKVTLRNFLSLQPYLSDFLANRSMPAFFYKHYAQKSFLHVLTLTTVTSFSNCSSRVLELCVPHQISFKIAHSSSVLVRFEYVVGEMGF